MGKIYLPYASQFDLMNENLARIANAISSDIDVSTWAGIQKAVRVGVAPDLIPAGTQLVTNHSKYGEIVFDVVAHNYFKSAHDKNAQTMTLLSHNCLAKAQFDAPEAFYYATDGLSPGTYNFTLSESYGNWAAGTYQFTLSFNLPKGGQLCISGRESAGSLTTLEVLSYDDVHETMVTDRAVISVGSGGTSLGTLGVELNHPHRASYGSNNYKESAIRQFLNSSASAGGVWTPQTKFDRAPEWATSLDGFVRGFDDDFLSVVGEVVVPCATNSVYESPDSTTVKAQKYTVTDKFYLASQREIFGTGSETLADDTSQFPYYEGATNADRIKYKDGSAAGWWLRSASNLNSGGARTVRSDGSLIGQLVQLSYGVVIACTIV